MKDLGKLLREYTAGDWYPFHMPGHKRSEAFRLPDPYSIDITEIDGFDDLNDPSGILSQMQTEAARICGSVSSRFLVNGSTAGVLAGIRALAPEGSEVIVSRQSHLSVFHAIELGRLVPHYLWPEGEDAVSGVLAPPSAEQTAGALRRWPRSSCVILTSPSYEGVISDLKGIAAACGRTGAKIFVDEAHGAHLPFTDPGASALSCGADIAVHGLHKTMPSLTQTALLHTCSRRVDQAAVDRALRLYQTSSPSYVLMASIVKALKWADEDPGAFRRYRAEMASLRKDMSACRNLRLFEGFSSGTYGGKTALDPGKILICDASGYAGGKRLYEHFRRAYRLQPEMYTERGVLFMTSPADSHDGLRRLLEAARETDRLISEKTRASGRANAPGAGRGTSARSVLSGGFITFVPEEPGSYISADMSFGLPRPEPVMTPAAAAAQRPWKVPLEQAEGKVCADYICPYPPGVPLAVPGERLDADVLDWVERMQEAGARIRGIDEGKVSVCDG